MTRILILLLFVSNSALAQVNLTQGLIAYYPFNGNANDVSGNNINGVVNNATLTTDQKGIANNAYYFDGATSYIQLPYSNLYNFAPQDSFSISVWVLPDQGFNSWPAQAIVVKSPFNSDVTLAPWNYGAYLWNYQAMSGYHQNNLLMGSTILTSTTCWYNIIVTYKNGIWNLYVNGILEASDNSQTKFILQDGAASTIAFGKKGQSFGDWYKGKMDEVRIYNRVLNQSEVTALYYNDVNEACTQLNCDNWLNTPSEPSWVNIGDLDVPGDQLTVEAEINIKGLPPNTVNYGDDIVSKHTGTSNANYLLRSDHAELSTTNGFFTTPLPCQIEMNKTYHVAMVYDGATLKYYRNGFLLSQVPATGNMIQNDFATGIGYISTPLQGENFIGYINEVRIWNVARSQAQLRAYMNTSLPNPATQTGLLAYYTFNDLVNKQGNTAWNGTLMGAASINATNPDCDFTADSCLCKATYDFSIQRDPCNPYSVTFQPGTTTFISTDWDFGDGNMITNNSNPTHLYTIPGNYTVKMMVNAACNDTITKTITVDVTNDNQLISTNDTTICLGTTKKLIAASSLSFCWSPTTYLDNPNSSTPVTSTPQNITYYYTSQVTGSNLIVNGNFSAGNTGFTSNYIYANPNITEGQYFVGPNPQAWNPATSSCIDHTTGTGNMLLVNGAPVPDVEVWSQTIPVTPNTNYIFSTWVQAIFNVNPAQLQFSINGNNIGSQITASLPTCTWSQFYTTWNSGNNTSAKISIVNKNTQVQGNDFALDDISFAPVFMKKDSVIITVDSPYIKTNNDTTFCIGGQSQLNTIGATTYSWSPTTSLTNPIIANPVASPTATTQYIVTGTDINGCTSKDTVLITINQKPVVSISNDTTICKNTSVQLTVSGGATYSWSPAATLNNPNISNPVAAPTGSTKYFVTVTDANTCTNIDSVYVRIYPDPIFTINNSSNVCLNSSTQLNATGGNIYSWQPAASLSNPNVANPIASPTTTTNYSVQITESTCNNSTTLSTTVTVFPLPTVSVTKSNDIDCSNDNSQLTANGAIQYSWSPSGTLNNPSIANPVARPIATTLYTVQGKDVNGCINADTITVYVNGNNQGGYLMPNAFTPNNDGLNDCYGIKYWGVIQELDFSIYNRWGQCVFHTTQPSQCWDGTFKGQKQNAGVYIYMIKAKTFCADNVFRKGTFVLIR